MAEQIEPRTYEPDEMLAYVTFRQESDYVYEGELASEDGMLSMDGKLVIIEAVGEVSEADAMAAVLGSPLLENYVPRRDVQETVPEWPDHRTIFLPPDFPMERVRDSLLYELEKDGPSGVVALSEGWFGLTCNDGEEPGFILVLPSPPDQPEFWEGG